MAGRARAAWASSRDEARASTKMGTSAAVKARGGRILSTLPWGPVVPTSTPRRRKLRLQASARDRS